MILARAYFPLAFGKCLQMGHKYRHGDSNPGTNPASTRKVPASRKQTENGKAEYSGKVENREHGNVAPVFVELEAADMPRFMTLIDMLSRMADSVPPVVVLAGHQWSWTSWHTDHRVPPPGARCSRCGAVVVAGKRASDE